MSAFYVIKNINLIDTNPPVTHPPRHLAQAPAIHRQAARASNSWMMNPKHGALSVPIGPRGPSVIFYMMLGQVHGLVISACEFDNTPLGGTRGVFEWH